MHVTHIPKPGCPRWRSPSLRRGVRDRQRTSFLPHATQENICYNNKETWRVLGKFLRQLSGKLSEIQSDRSRVTSHRFPDSDGLGPTSHSLSIPLSRSNFVCIWFHFRFDIRHLYARIWYTQCTMHNGKCTEVRRTR